VVKRDEFTFSQYFGQFDAQPTSKMIMARSTIPHPRVRLCNFHECASRYSFDRRTAFPCGILHDRSARYDLLTGVFMLTPLAYIAGRPSVTVSAMMRNWCLVFIGNFAGALTIALMMSVIFTFGFTLPPDKIGQVIGHVGESRTISYAELGVAGLLTLFIRAILCNWMVSTAVAGAMMSYLI
jgi:formate/nitrite transporter FocA (FNT family)